MAAAHDGEDLQIQFPFLRFSDYSRVSGPRQARKQKRPLQQRASNAES
jgi:hypothetical protein